MTPSTLEEVSQQLTNVLNNAMAMASDYISHAAVTLDSPPEDLRRVIGLAESLLDTLQAVFPPKKELDTATSLVKPHRTYATAARDTATTDTPPAGQPVLGSQQKKPNHKPNPPSSKHDEGKPTTQLVLRFCKPVKNYPHPHFIHEAVNAVLPPHTKVAGVNVTRTRNMVLHSLPSSSAALLAEHSDIITKTLKLILGLEAPPSLMWVNIGFTSLVMVSQYLLKVEASLCPWR
jgi:hypothetical protein